MMKELTNLRVELSKALQELAQLTDDSDNMLSEEYEKQYEALSDRIGALNQQIEEQLNANSGQRKQSEKIPMENAKGSVQSNRAISQLIITPLNPPRNSVVGICSATFYNALTVNGITINVNGNNEIYVRMPQKRTQQGRYIDVAHPLSRKGRENINQTILSAFRQGVHRQRFEVATPLAVSAQNSVKYPPEYGNSLARMDLVVNDMVVHNAKIIRGKDGDPHLVMPSYKSKDGEYVSICNPANKEAFAVFSEKAIEEFNTEYQYFRLNDSEVAELSENGVKAEVHKISDDSNVVKVKPADVEKVNAIINPTQNLAPKA